MKRIGIIGGIGPASTLDYYSGIIDGFRNKIDIKNYPEILINSINMTEMLSHISNENWDALTDSLLHAIRDLANAGAEFAAIASNTPHIVFDRIDKISPLPLISIVEETCRYAISKKCTKAVVIGTLFTMNSTLYTDALKRHGITAIVPAEDERIAIHNIIFPKLEDGIVVPEDKEKMLTIVKRLVSVHNADAVILGCTELPLMIKGYDLDILTLNTTQIHIEAIVRYLAQ